MDDLIKRARTELEPPWDDLREARVLSRVLEHEGGAGQRPWWQIPSIALAGAAALAGLLLLVRGVSGPAPAAPSAPRSTGAASASTPGVAASVLALADGSKAHLRPGAEVRALEQSASRVRLLQPAGEVRYDVLPDPGRSFTVVARGVEVQVLGTLFTVSVEPAGVGVQVERGRVSVKNGARAVELAAGERLLLSGSELVEHSAAAPRAEASSAPSTPVATASASEQIPETVDTWIKRADRARAAGDLVTAEKALAQVVREHAGDPRATSAAFSLGRVQAARGNFSAAARTFEALRKRTPRGPLAEDALAEAANAWALAGSVGQARVLAGQYLSQYPQGPHAERMRRLGGP